MYVSPHSPFRYEIATAGELISALVSPGSRTSGSLIYLTTPALLPHAIMDKLLPSVRYLAYNEICVSWISRPEHRGQGALW
jgi:hypothetical protein